MSLQPRKAHNLLNELRVSCRSSENGGVWHVQEMTGRRPEGGEERTTAARSTYRNLQRDKEPVVFFTGFTFYRVSSHWSPMFLSGSCILGPGHSCPPSRLPPSLLPGPDTLPPPPSSFQEATRFPHCRHRKVSHLLPITFGCGWFAASHLGQGGVSARSCCSRRH